MTKANVVYICLSCNNTKSRYITKGEYTETVPCKKCEEEMVDVWVRHKYEKKEQSSQRNIVVLKSGQRVEVNGDVHLFNEQSPGIFNPKLQHRFNSQEVRYITSNNLEDWTTEELLKELSERDEVYLVDTREDVFKVQVDLTDECTKKITIIKNNFNMKNTAAVEEYRVNHLG
jgi:hypothetical protein